MDVEDDEEDADVPVAVLDAKIAQYEAFIEEVLKRELRKSLDEFRRGAEVLEQCRELRRNIDLLIRDDVTELETMVDVGCQMFVKAFVPDTSRIFLDVGLGFQLEMPLAGAREFLENKEQHILGGLELRKRSTAQVKADIHEALHLLDMMMQVKSGGTPWLDSCDKALVASFSDRNETLIDNFG
mmetsp:Transcript_59292/g.150528  ORF Transcript_59292/g.150528 Transcript_59292/m.150528 type:complete len:184 (-) Transcript_59292:54-605(-)